MTQLISRVRTRSYKAFLGVWWEALMNDAINFACRDALLQGFLGVWWEALMNDAINFARRDALLQGLFQNLVGRSAS